MPKPNGTARIVRQGLGVLAFAVGFMIVLADSLGLGRSVSIEALLACFAFGSTLLGIEVPGIVRALRGGNDRRQE